MPNRHLSSSSRRSPRSAPLSCSCHAPAPALRAQAAPASTRLFCLDFAGDPLDRPAVADRRPSPGAPNDPRSTTSARRGRRLEDDRWRPHLASGSDGILQKLVCRRDRDLRIESRHRLCRDGGDPAARQHHPGRRRLQDHRRRPHVDARRPREARAIGRIRVHPENPDIVYVAALGDPYGPNPDRGVFKSTDGGKTWDRVLFRDEKTGAVDLVVDPKIRARLYAGLWEVFRTPHSMSSGGPGSGLFKTTDGGKTWTESDGIPACQSRCGVRSASPYRARIRVASMRSSKPRKGASSCPTMAARRGSSLTTTATFVSAPSTTRACTPTRRRRTPSTSSITVLSIH